jgi:indole-3-glycerol phosphate synthase
MCREELSLISERVNLPVLRKEFIVEPYQIYEARALGADAVLLIASALSISELAELNNLTAALGMEALIEVHSEAELDTVLEIDARLIGVNSRDLRTFKTDLSLVERIAEIVREEAPDVALVAESGMSTPAQLRNLRPLGVQGFLIGEALLTSEHPEEKLRQLLAAGESQGAQS